jgi:DNA-binding response OmpR family regulator
MKWTLLYIDDLPLNIECYRDLLEPNFHVIGTHKISEVPQLLSQEPYHGIMLDIHMPTIDGFDLYEQICAHQSYNGCPVFFISGDASLENKMKSYEKGGVDFIPRDLKYDELQSRLVNKIRLFQQTSTKISFGNLTLDIEALNLSVNGKMIDLTLNEYKILLTILRALPAPIKRSEVMTTIWGNDPIKPGTVNTHLTNLRSKVEEWDYTIKVKDELICLVK